MKVPKQTSASQLEPKPGGKRLFDFIESLFFVFLITNLLIFFLALFLRYKSITNIFPRNEFTEAPDEPQLRCLPVAPPLTHGANHQSEAGSPLIKQGHFIPASDLLGKMNPRRSRCKRPAIKRRIPPPLIRCKAGGELGAPGFAQQAIFFFILRSKVRGGFRAFDGGTLWRSAFLIGRLCLRRNVG